MDAHFAPLVSVITPTYNHESFIRACIDSVCAQTYVNWEQIIIDDGSSDRTAELVEKYPDPRIRYIRQPHRGVEKLAYSYNDALRVSRGELVAILEGDDIWPRDKLSQLIPSFRDPTIVLAYGAVGELSADGTWAGRLTKAVRRRRGLPLSLLSNSPPRSATAYMLTADGTDLVPPSTAVIRRSSLEAIGGFQYVPGLFVTDFPTFLRLSLEGRFYYTSQVAGFRRRHRGSVTMQHLQTIATRARKHAFDFLLRHDVKLSAKDRKKLARSWEASVCSNEFTEGRLKLVAQQWGQARLHFLRAFNFMQPRVTFAAATGWIASWLRCDLEGAIRLAGRADIRG
jgi:glycosyltransferase involved in cell wall biosynthesis